MKPPDQHVAGQEASSPRLSAPMMAGLMAGPFLTMVDSSVVNVAVPDIARSLHTDLPTVQWTVSAYLLALASMLAASAWLTRRYGTRVVYLVCLAAFTAASALCALAPGVSWLVAARVVQGLAGAPLTPIAMSMMMSGDNGAADQSRGSAAAVAMVLFLAPAVGPTVGGVLIQAFGWPSIFLVNVPFGILGFCGALAIPARLHLAGDRGARLDPAGLGMLAMGSALALYGAGQGAGHHWTDGSIWPFWSSGLVLLGAYAVRSWRRPDPILSLRALREAEGSLAIGLTTLVSVVSFAALFLVPVLMQTIQGFSAFQAGLTLLPQGVVMGVGTVIGTLVTRTGRVRTSVLVGSVILAATTAGLLLVQVETPAWEAALVLCGRGLAFGLITQPLLVGMMGALDRAQSADASTLFNVIQRLAGSFGIGLLATVFSVRAAQRVQDVLGGLGAPGGAATLAYPARSALSGAPPAVRQAIEAALGAAFHDVVWVLVAVSGLGIVLALLLAASARAVPVTRPAASAAGPAAPDPGRS